MGWDYDTKPEGMSVIDFLASTFSNDVIAGEIVYDTAYLALRNPATGRVSAVVCPFKLGDQGGVNIAWKAMREDVEPFYYECPAHILELLSPTDSVGAQVWRAECRRRLTGKEVGSSR